MGARILIQFEELRRHCYFDSGTDFENEVAGDYEFVNEFVNESASRASKQQVSEASSPQVKLLGM